MILTLKDKTVYYIDDIRGAILNTAIENGTLPEFVILNGLTVSSALIAKIEAGGAPPRSTEEVLRDFRAEERKEIEAPSGSSPEMMAEAMTDPIQGEWVIGRYEGRQALVVAGQAERGIGYYLIENHSGEKNPWCVAVFCRPMDSVRPEHLALLTKESEPEIWKAMRQKCADRHGLK